LPATTGTLLRVCTSLLVYGRSPRAPTSWLGRQLLLLHQQLIILFFRANFVYGIEPVEAICQVLFDLLAWLRNTEAAHA
jgi:hypothetical protein